MRQNTVRAALREGKAQVGTWLSLSSPMAARYMARVGFDWITLDIEHSPASWETAALIFGAVADAGNIPLARVPSISHENAKRALDAGAFGIVFPMCLSADEASEAVAACRYPPAGRRSVGGGMHSLNFSAPVSEYYRSANEEILVIVQIEHITAVERCEEICSVPGLDAIFVGPNDLLSSMGQTPAMESDHPDFVAALRHVRETASRLGVAPGIHVANGEAAQRFMADGWKFIAVSSDLGFMTQAAVEEARKALGDGAQGGGIARY